MFANHEDQGHLSVTQNWQFRSVDQDLDGHRHFSREAVIENSKHIIRNIGNWDPLRDNKSAHGPTYKQMPNNPGNKGHWGNEPVILPRPVKTKGIHPLESGFQKREKNLGNLRLWEWAKRSTECGPQILSTRRKNSNEHPSHQNQRSYWWYPCAHWETYTVHLQINTITQN